MNIEVFNTVSSLDPATGGPARSVPSLAEAVQSAGADVHVFVNKNSNKKIQSTQNIHFLKSISSIEGLPKAILESKSKALSKILIHNHGIWLPLNHIVAVTSRKLSVPMVLSPRGMLEPWAMNFSKWKKLVAWYLYQRQDCKTSSIFHATSENEARNLDALRLSIPIAVIPNGVYIPNELERINVPKNTKIALFIGRIHPVKGLINFVKAWAKTRPIDWEILIAGPDENGHQKEVEQEINRLGLNDLFQFTGEVKEQDKWSLYKQADLFILPTFTENFGIVIAEALACGIPVITTKGAPWKELVTHDCGWWTDIGVEPLAQAILEATSLSVEERQEMGKRGRKLIELNYSWDRIGKEMLSVYHWVLHGGRQPNCVITE